MLDTKLLFQKNTYNGLLNLSNINLNRYIYTITSIRIYNRIQLSLSKYPMFNANQYEKYLPSY